MTGLHKHEPAQAPFLIGHLVDMGDALNAACSELARDPTPERCDRLIMQLKGAEHALGRFRRALLADEDPANVRD